MTPRKRTFWTAALTLAIVVIALLAKRDHASSPSTADARAELPLDPQAAPASPGAADSSPASAASGPPRAERLRARAERDALLARIEGAQHDTPAASVRAPTATRDQSQLRRADDPDRPGNLVDRMGGRSQIVAHLNREFIPLARDCIQQAMARSPQLRGMLTLHVGTVADEHLGAVVERAEVPATSAVQEHELAECVRENALTITFPPPLQSGAEQFELTLRIEPPESATPP